MAKTRFKTAHLTNYYHKSSGGISTSYNNLLAAAERHRRETILIVPGEASSLEHVNDFARIYFVPAKQSPVFDKRYRILMPWQYMKGDSEIRKILLDEDPDLIEVTDKYTLSMMGAMIRIGKFSELGRKILVHFSCERMDDNIGSFLTKGSAGRTLARSVMANYLLPSFDYHLANSEYTAAEFRESAKHYTSGKRKVGFMNRCWRKFKAPRVPLSQRIKVCPRGVDTKRFNPEKHNEGVRSEMVERAGIPESSVILLYAGRVSPEKNVELLPKMLAELAKDKTRDYRLLVAGAGPLEIKLQEMAENDAPGKLIQLGHLDKDTLSGYYANADVFVHPNPREPFGIAPLEAMASGVATVAPNAGGILTYADDNNAWLVEPTGEAFAAAVASVVSDPAAREKKASLAVETARNNSREAATDGLFAAYDKIYEDFSRRKELFTDVEAASEFDFLPLIDV